MLTPFARIVFVVEALTTFATGVLCVAAPAVFVASLASDPGSPAMLELTRWYGIVLVVIALVLAGALRSGDETLAVVLGAMLVGDVAQVAAGLWSRVTLGGWSSVTASAVLSSIPLAALRVACLRRRTRAERTGAKIALTGTPDIE